MLHEAAGLPLLSKFHSLYDKQAISNSGPLRLNKQIKWMLVKVGSGQTKQNHLSIAVKPKQGKSSSYY